MNWACLLSDESKGVLLAGEETERLAHRYIRTEHLTLGLLREENLSARAVSQAGPRVCRKLRAHMLKFAFRRLPPENLE